MAITTDSIAECPGENYRILCSPIPTHRRRKRAAMIVNYESYKEQLEWLKKKGGSCISAWLPQLLPPVLLARELYGATLSTTGIVIDLAGLANSMMLI